MKKKYEKPEVDLFEMVAEDQICVSGAGDNNEITFYGATWVDVD